jgi:hypothetical protein
MTTNNSSSANDYSRLGVVTQDDTHNYKQLMDYCMDTDNWFLRARGLWDEERFCRCDKSSDTSVQNADTD